MTYTPSTSRVAIATIFATTTSEMLVRPCSDVSSAAAALRCAGTRPGNVLALVVLSGAGLMIKSMSRETQFLLVTHSKRMMTAADLIYGVTMQEPGVSKLVSVRFNEAATRPIESTEQQVAALAGAVG